MSYKILNGNELIIQGGLEAGFSLYTGYPGSPLADYFNILHSRKNELQEKGIRVALGNTEANAAAMAGGAKQAGRNVMVGMKSMGLHVASDALSVGNFANPGQPYIDPETGESIHSGVVVVVGDDPWSMSTSTAADSRYLFKHLHMPFLEPSTPQELKDWIAHSLELSQRSSLYAGVLVTTFIAEGGGRVQLGEESEVPNVLTEFDPSTFNLSESVMVPPNSFKADVRMIRERFPKVKKVLKELALDRQFGNAESKVGFISSGVVFETLKQIMQEEHYLDDFSLYKVACSYPLVDDLLVPWLQKLDTLVVVEEKRGFLENELISLCQEHGVKVRVYGKDFVVDKEHDGEQVVEGFPADGGISYEIMRDKLNTLMGLLGLRPCQHKQPELIQLDTALPMRLPTFCPGCPHRETLSLLKELRKVFKEEEGINLISHGDVGCYSLSFLEPFKEMHDISAMGQGGAFGAGMDLFSQNPSVVLMGDSTFFHSGLSAISNSVQLGHNITYIVLDNDFTAMTGHQMSPSTGQSVEGRKRPEQDMLNLVRGMGVDEAMEVNPSDRYFYQNVLKDMVKKSGTKVIVSNKECGLTFAARKKSQDRKIFGAGETKPVQTFFQINTSACEDCRACVEMTGCPGLSQTEDAYGPKTFIDPQICVSDGYCTKILACPSFEKVEVINYHPTRYQNAADNSAVVHNDSALPEPVRLKSFDDILAGNDWRVVVTGVGGTGVTTISRVLAEAGEEMNGLEGLDFKFMDQKGLAQRNGRVTGHLSIFSTAKSASAITPVGTADLVLSPDLLDGSAALPFLAPFGEALLDEEFQIPLSILLDYGEDNEVLTSEKLRKQLTDKLGDRVFLSPMKEVSHRQLGKGVYASAVLLGIAYQKGMLPFTEDNMKDAFRRSVPKAEYDNNWKAFELGRRVVVMGVEAFRNQFLPQQETSQFNLFRDSVRDSAGMKESADELAHIFDTGLARLKGLFPAIEEEHLANYVHDLVVYDRKKALDAFMADAEKLAQLYPAGDNQRIALRVLVKTHWIKDEVFVAHLMVSPLKKARDEQAYKHLGTDFRIVHINRPEFELMDRRFAFEFSPKEWMLKAMRHQRWFRNSQAKVHEKEHQIAQRIRRELLETVPNETDDQRKALMRLDNIKGYRQVRYEKAEKVFPDLPSSPSKGGKNLQQIPVVQTHQP
ncbi:thiamine pyrophosphate-dependent enzyme [Oceanospirillum beijerinckii]|uniref:thiamine pyrophosphate-dependent enzyme n=1 Tax=Oceanospirillum beijerinckii TaxID=64976 RepID=UPI00041237CF|nr:thiamine pyrophosphate-dependent enzyme [Oceanospirillum beijerinckii]